MQGTVLASIGFATILALSGSGPVSGGGAAGTLADDISGIWILDAKASDDVDVAMPAAGGPGTGTPSIRRGGQAGGGRPPAGGRMIIRSEVVATVRALAELPDRLVIEREGEVVRLGAPGAGTVRVTPGSAPLGVDWFDGAPVHVGVEWLNGALRLTRERDRVVAVDTFRRDASSSRLIVTSRITGGVAMEVNLTRYYDLQSDS